MSYGTKGGRGKRVLKEGVGGGGEEEVGIERGKFFNSSSWRGAGEGGGYGDGSARLMVMMAY